MAGTARGSRQGYPIISSDDDSVHAVAVAVTTSDWPAREMPQPILFYATICLLAN